MPPDETRVGEIVVDVATTAVPQEVIRRVEAAGFKAKPTGIEHGTVTAIIDGRPFEVTTLREDVETFGRKAKVAFGRDWKADAERRDFATHRLREQDDRALGRRVVRCACRTDDAVDRGDERRHACRAE